MEKKTIKINSECEINIVLEFKRKGLRDESVYLYTNDKEHFLGCVNTINMKQDTVFDTSKYEDMIVDDISHSILNNIDNSLKFTNNEYEKCKKLIDKILQDICKGVEKTLYE